MTPAEKKKLEELADTYVKNVMNHRIATFGETEYARGLELWGLDELDSVDSETRPKDNIFFGKSGDDVAGSNNEYEKDMFTSKRDEHSVAAKGSFENIKSIQAEVLSMNQECKNYFMQVAKEKWKKKNPA